MTTVSVVECVSPASLRSCGSSAGSLLQNRRRLQCISPKKRSSCHKYSNSDARDYGLEGTLVSSPIASPIPRSTGSIYGGRVSRNTVMKSSSSSSDEFGDDDLDEEILRTQSRTTPDLFVVGSKPRLHGMWEIPDSQSVTPLKDHPAVTHNADNIFDLAEEEDRTSCISPDNPPPSPINFRPSVDGFVIGGEKLMCPERCHSSPTSYSRDFNPGFVKQTLHHCVKCEGRVLEEELSQVTLHRRLSSILSRHASKQNFDEDTLNYCKEQSKTKRMRMPDQVNTQIFSHSLTSAQEKSFYEIYTERKRFKEETKRCRKERERQMKEQREKRKEDKRVEEMAKLNQKLKMKEERSQKILKNSKMGRYGAMKQTSTDMYKDFEVNEESNASVDLNPINGTDDLHLPPICAKRNSASLSANAKKKHLPKLEHLSSATDRTASASVDANYHIKRSWSDVCPLENPVPTDSRKTETDTEEKEKKKTVSVQSRFTQEYPLPTFVSSWKPYNEKCSTVNLEFNSSTTLTASVYGLMSNSTGINSELQQIPDSTADETCSRTDTSKHGG